MILVTITKKMCDNTDCLGFLVLALIPVTSTATRLRQCSQGWWWWWWW